MVTRIKAAQKHESKACLSGLSLPKKDNTGSGPTEDTETQVKIGFAAFNFSSFFDTVQFRKASFFPRSPLPKQN